MNLFSLLNGSSSHHVIASKSGLGVSVFQEMTAALKSRNVRALQKTLNKTGASKHFFASYVMQTANVGWVDGVRLLLEKEYDGIYFAINPTLNERGRVVMSGFFSITTEDLNFLITSFGGFEFEKKKKFVNIFLSEKKMRSCIKESQNVKEKLKI